MNLKEAWIEASRRWGADGYVFESKNYGESKPYCYVVGTRSQQEPLGTSGESWEDAFRDADSRKGQHKVCSVCGSEDHPELAHAEWDGQEKIQ